MIARVSVWARVSLRLCTVSIASYVESLMGHGIPPIQKAIDTGIRPSLSIDVETSVHRWGGNGRALISVVLEARNYWHVRETIDQRIRYSP